MAAAVPPALEISLLGPPRVTRDGRPVAFDTRKATALLAHLALADHPRSRESLCALLWPEQDPERGRGALRRTLSVLRSAVGAEWLDTAADSIALRDGPELEVDVRRFRSLAAGDAGADALADAVDLFRGEFMEGFGLRDSAEFDTWLVYEGDDLRRELGDALGRLVRELVAAGDYARAVPHARRWLALDPLHEPAHRELIRSYALSGDRAAAIDQYRACVRELSHGLGVAPVEETALLFEQVSEGTLPAPAPLRAAPRPEVAAPAELPLVGREEELRRLAAVCAEGGLVIVEGEAGIGKSRLVREVAAQAAAGGVTVLAARCYEEEAALPYGPVLELLGAALAAHGPALVAAAGPRRIADASLLLPELAGLAPDLPAPVTPELPGAQARLLDAVAGVLSAVPALVVVDDAHAADAASLDVLAYAGRRAASRGLALVLTWRREGAPAGHPLQRLAAESGGVLRLGRLGEAEVARLVPAGRAAEVFAESEGLPLFVAEALQASGPAPAGMRDLLAARVAAAEPLARQLLEAAAVIGRSFGLETVRAASGRSDEETADAVEALVARGLVRELPGPDAAYDFTHGKVRELVYEQTSHARRRLLHRRVAAALARAVPGPEGAAALAGHLGAAGDRDAAAEQHRRAAAHAASVLAHADALEHLDAALALGHPDVAGLHEEMGVLRTLGGDYAGALASLEAAAAAAAAPEDLPRIEHRLGGVHQRRGEWDRAERRYAVAFEALGDGDPALRARILADLSFTLMEAGDLDRAAECATEAAELAAAAGDDRARAQAHNLLGVLAVRAGLPAEGRGELEISLALAESLDDAGARAAALNNLALVARSEGELDRALELTESSLALCVAQGDRHREAALENNLADLHHAAGRTEESMLHLKRAVTIFAEVGADESTRLPEIWKLVSW